MPKKAKAEEEKQVETTEKSPKKAAPKKDTKPTAAPTRVSARTRKPVKYTDHDTGDGSEDDEPKKGKKRSKAAAEEEDHEEEPAEEKPKKKGKKAKGNKRAKPTIEMIEKIKELAKELEENNNANDLKEMLKKNGRPSSGSKGELALRVSDGQLRGSLDKCKSCGGGNLHLDLSTDELYCKGYMEDTDFVYCHFREDSANVARKTWQK